jgi:hypothetical protein
LTKPLDSGDFIIRHAELAFDFPIDKRKSRNLSRVQRRIYALAERITFIKKSIELGFGDVDFDHIDFDHIFFSLGFGLGD